MTNNPCATLLAIMFICVGCCRAEDPLLRLRDPDELKFLLREDLTDDGDLTDLAARTGIRQSALQQVACRLVRKCAAEGGAELSFWVAGDYRVGTQSDDAADEGTSTTLRLRHQLPAINSVFTRALRTTASHLGIEHGLAASACAAIAESEGIDDVQFATADGEHIQLTGSGTATATTLMEEFESYRHGDVRLSFVRWFRGSMNWRIYLVRFEPGQDGGYSVTGLWALSQG